MILKYDRNYKNLLLKILLYDGEYVVDKSRNTRCLTIPQHVFEYTPDEPPLLTLKQCYPVSSWAEMLGYYRRYSNAADFARIGASTWFADANKDSWQENPNCKGENDMGQVYGASLSPNEIAKMLSAIKNKRDDRGLLINFWKPELFDKGCLRPCVFSHQFIIVGNTLHLTVNQRSCDVALGLPFNSFSVWVKLKIFSEIAGLEMGNVKHVISHAHIYEDHIDKCKLMLSRTPIPNTTPSVVVNDWVKEAGFDSIINSRRHARDYFIVEGYKHHKKINMKMLA